jgi:DNA repair photolyase
MTPINPSGLWKKRLGDWVINPYVGCEHGCFHCHCPAMPGVKFNNNGHRQNEWGKYLLPKHGIVEALRDQLRNFTPDKARKTEWGDGWVLMSFLTDCYTPSEAKYKLTRQCLQLLLEAGHKVRLQTRSALVERDFDLLVAHKKQVLLGTSLPYLDDSLARALEPRATAPSRRLKMLQKAFDRGIEVYVAVAPFMPFHDHHVMDEVLKAIRPLKPREIFCEVLNPKGDNLAMMHNALAAKYPAQAQMMANYSGEYWAKFTWKVLSFGLTKNDRFIPWPDTQRFWKTYLGQKETKLLDAYLPSKEMQTEAISA